MLIIYLYLVSVLAIFFSQYQLMQLICWKDSYLKYDCCVLSGLKERERIYLPR